MNDLKQLIKNIEQWAEKRNLIEGSTPQKQFIKLMEEFGELCSGVSKNKVDVVKDSIGDCFVVMVILARQFKRDDILADMSYIEMHPPFQGDIARSLIDTNASMQAFFFAHERKEHENVMNFFAYTVLGLVEATDYYHLDLDDCVQSAWEEIKDRKGKMIDGVFVKEDDLRPVGRSKLLGASYGNK
ncbi:MazG-like family protein [Rodentibacter pneumotropicus]|uniref:MazG-like family protein n=2 Tax=Rodentibacter pneumotropicus TaxID=758 RepID=UPI0009852A4A|nr:MazG-like family protein [Rodentibacter pneumotropicus]OOF64790.1 pyrophosphatase [Rodentibacter pneumotropicus]